MHGRTYLQQSVILLGAPREESKTKTESIISVIQPSSDYSLGLHSLFRCIWHEKSNLIINVTGQWLLAWAWRKDFSYSGAKNLASRQWFYCAPIFSHSSVFNRLKTPVSRLISISKAGQALTDFANCFIGQFRESYDLSWLATVWKP